MNEPLIIGRGENGTLYDPARDDKGWLVVVTRTTTTVQVVPVPEADMVAEADTLHEPGGLSAFERKIRARAVELAAQGQGRVIGGPWTEADADLVDPGRSDHDREGLIATARRYPVTAQPVPTARPSRPVHTTYESAGFVVDVAERVNDRTTVVVRHGHVAVRLAQLRDGSLAVGITSGGSRDLLVVVGGDELRRPEGAAPGPVPPVPQAAPGADRDGIRPGATLAGPFAVSMPADHPRAEVPAVLVDHGTRFTVRVAGHGKGGTAVSVHPDHPTGEQGRPAGLTIAADGTDLYHHPYNPTAAQPHTVTA